MLYIIAIFCIILTILLGVVYEKWSILKEKYDIINKELSYYKQTNSSLNKEVDELERVLDNRKMLYDEELKNFKKILDLYGTKQLDIIPYVYSCNMTNIGRPYGETEDVIAEEESYTIPSINIRFCKILKNNK